MDEVVVCDRSAPRDLQPAVTGLAPVQVLRRLIQGTARRDERQAHRCTPAGVRGPQPENVIFSSWYDPLAPPPSACLAERVLKDGIVL